MGTRVVPVFLIIGIAFMAIGATRGQRVFSTIGLVFLVLGLARLVRARSRR
jgi:hypothetical protein